MYENRVGPIDTLPKSEVEDILIRSIRFAKWLRFYDAYIGAGKQYKSFPQGVLNIFYLSGMNTVFLPLSKVLEMLKYILVVLNGFGKMRQTMPKQVS